MDTAPRRSESPGRTRPDTRLAVACLQAFSIAAAIGCTFARPAAPTTVVVVVQSAPASVPTPQPAVASTPTPAVASAPTPAAARAVMVRWGTAWYPGRVIADECGPWSRIRFDGYGEEWDSVVGPGDLRPAGAPTPAVDGAAQDEQRPRPHGARRGVVARPATVDAEGAAQIDPQATLTTGAALYARSGSGWYRASVLREECGGLVRIRYVGWEAVWDETVPRDRLRIPAAADAPAAAQ